METQKQETGAVVKPELARHRSLSFGWMAIVIAITIVVITLAVNQLFNAGFFVGYTWLDNEYQYALFGLLVPIVFLIFPASGKSAMDKVPWYDALFALTTFGLLVFFFMNAERILDNGWEMGAPDHIVTLGFILWLLVLEATRRAGGTALFTIVLIISLYPLYADIMPGPISGLGSSLADTTAYHVLSAESMLGIPMQALANLVIGFLIFGVALTQTGGGKFFIDLAFAALGHVRGGPAKVAIFSSGLMGSMSGSVISNVITTGVMTIPAMRKTGFRASYAAGVEACASTGGVLMPPIMGSTAFIMAVFLNIPYITIAVAAIIPSILYYLALFIQIDAYAAKNNMPGLPKEQLPKLGETFRAGWHFIAVFILLIVMLVYLKQEVLAPFYATALLLIINQIFSKERWGMKEFWAFILAAGKLLAEIAAILVGVGLIVGALSITGMAGTLVNDLVFIAGGDILVLLLMGAIASFIMGIGMTVTAAYIFLAIVLAPALIQGGLDPLSVHLFILYWGMVSFITPPVALGAFAAASIAGASPMRTGFEAMRLGSIIYFVPFFFVLDPAFILNGELSRTALLFVCAVGGVILVASSLQGYLVWIGNLHRHPILGWPIRALVLIGGLALATPGGSDLIPFSDLELALFALATAGPAAAVAYMLERRAKAAMA
ncbi:TRAP transporter fused permease subunit [uncultured Sneathiella sp.]|jgi:TRAP transporter 4TM/12TM fusion protein|uniref:TRAP transporter permease n=1 Tax=uncultured Sneathiella sp. TaxID=879315 RepID=UPI0030DAF67D|tara:strand:+ start:10794 stop:12788 length:1995 start_codon:yes stop_codon:yes gene_type:complete